MFIPVSVVLRRIPLAVAVALLGLNLSIAAAQTFAISAAPTTTSPLGAGSIPYTVSGIPISGSLIIGCQYAGLSTYQEEARLPICGAGPVFAISVTAGQTVNGAISLVPWGSPIPVALHRAPHRTHRILASGFLFAGALLLGLTLRRNNRRWFSLILIAAGMQFIAAGLSACGGSSNGPVPGVYPYTLTAAVNSTSPAILTAAVSTTANVIIP